MSAVLRLIKLSRPRFWFYLVGPFILPFLAVRESFAADLQFVVVGSLFFLLFGNLFIYGVNDIFDEETDALNPKKSSYELRYVRRLDLKPLTLALTFSFLGFGVYLALLDATLLFLYAGFLFFGYFYSAQPVRAKAIPILDGVFNVLYIFPGFLASYYVFGSVSLLAGLAGLFWCMAMHAFSAIPDIGADRGAGVRTTATLLQKNGTILYCAILWSASAALASIFLHSVLPVFLLALYLLFLFLAARRSSLFSVYTWFPYLNFLSGMLLSLYLLFF